MLYNLNGTINIEIDNSVSNFLMSCRQFRPLFPLRAGFMFARFPSDKKIKIESIYEYDRDRCTHSRQDYIELGNYEYNLDIFDYHFNNGLHFVGTWQTMQNYQPHLSQFTRDAIFEGFKKSDHQLNFFLHIIVGWQNDSKTNPILLAHTDKQHQYADRVE